jgi:hypothetical protein
MAKNIENTYDNIDSDEWPNYVNCTLTGVNIIMYYCVNMYIHNFDNVIKSYKFLVFLCLRDPKLLIGLFGVLVLL